MKIVCHDREITIGVVMYYGFTSKSGEVYFDPLNPVWMVQKTERGTTRYWDARREEWILEWQTALCPQDIYHSYEEAASILDEFKWG